MGTSITTLTGQTRKPINEDNSIMKTHTGKPVYIEKYEITHFEKEQKPYTMVLTHVIQMIPVKHAQEFLLWVYLQSLPSTWKPNKTHLTHHFNISDRTYERYMSWLNSVGLIEYRQTRTKEGTFGKGRLIVLNGLNFNLEATSTGTVKIDGAVIDKRKKQKLSTDKNPADPTNLSVPKKRRETLVDIETEEPPPERQIPAIRSKGAHINTTKRNRNTIRKTKPETVSVFLEKESVKNHIQAIAANRNILVEDEIVDQIAYYVGENCVYDEAIKKINIALKKLREGKWNIPHGFNGITLESIRLQEEAHARDKRAQYAAEAKAFQTLNAKVKEKTPHISLAERLAKLRDGLHDNAGKMPENNIQYSY